MSVKIKTKTYGEIEINEKLVIHFPEGILGFDYIRHFAFIDSDDPSSPLKWLQAVEEPDLAFVVINVEDFVSDYELVIAMSDYDAIEVRKGDEILVLAIVTIPSDPREMTANLQGPIILNPVKRLGKQAISLSDAYTVREKILDLLQRAGREV